MKKTGSFSSLASPPSLAHVPVQTPYYNPSAALSRWQQSRVQKQVGLPRVDQILQPSVPPQHVVTQNPPYRPDLQTIMDAGTGHLDYADELRKRFPGL